MRKLELSIAWRYLRSRKGSRLLSFITVIAIGGVVVGVSALIVIIGVMNGLQRDLREKILVGSPDIRVLTYGDELKMSDWQSALETVREQPGVVAAAPFVMTQGLVTAGNDYVEGVYIVGLEPERPGSTGVTSIRQHATRGDFTFRSSGTSGRGAVVGRLLAQRLNVWPGDRITLISAAGAKLNPVLGAPVPQYHTFDVTGIFESGMYEYDNAYVYVALDAGKAIAGLGDAVTGIEVRTTDRWSAPTVATEIAQSLGFPFRTVDWQEQNRSLFQALKLEKLGMGIILLLIVVVAAFNIVSTLTMVVTDKTREIGILKAMGMPASSIRRIFFAQGLVIGVVGTTLGLLLGLGAAYALEEGKFIELDPQIYFIDHLPVATQPVDIVLILVASIAIAALATLYPARQAARLYPVEAIRHE